MSNPPDPVTLALTGALPSVLLAGSAIAFPLALGLLRLYRRAVLRGMNQAAGAGDGVASAAAVTAPAAPAPPPLAFATLDPRPTGGAVLPGPSAWRAAGLYAVAIAAYAAVMTAAWLLATRDSELLSVKLAFLFWTYLWPAVPAVNLAAATDRATRVRVAAGYFAVYAVIAALALARSADLSTLQVVQHWLITNGPPTVLLAAFLARRIRAVGPIVLAFALLAVLGANVAVALVGASDASMHAAVAAGSALGLGGTAIFGLTMALGLAAFGAGAWFVLQWLGKRYAARRLSDEMLTLDAMLLVFGFTQSIGLAFAHWAWIGSGMVGFVAYRIAAHAGYRRLPRVQAPRRLLLLRVFALGARSEPLFDALRRRWLRAGGIAMIAGPDLVSSAVEPHEFLAFLAGKLQRSFVAGDADLAARVAAMDHRPDPDGRFRVDEFFCRADTWQPTMRRLVAESDAVLMDLRSFSAANQGCVYELGRLLDAIALDRVVFVIDASTDRPFLERTLLQLWTGLDAESPNRRTSAPVVRLLELHGPTAAEARAMVEHLGSGHLSRIAEGVT